MRGEYDEVAEAIRIEHNSDSDDLLIVFRVTNPKYKQLIKQNWTKDIEFRVVDKKLVIFKDE